MKSVMMEAADAATRAAAEKEFNEHLPQFCKLLHIQPALLELNSPTLLMLVNMRLMNHLMKQIRQLDDRIQQLELDI